jgi:hypothetical protein
MHGKGIWISRNGDRYEGGYFEGFRNGNGVYFSQLGEIHEVKFLNKNQNDYSIEKMRIQKYIPEESRMVFNESEVGLRS